MVYLNPTLQGGNGRSTTTGGVPNVLGSGIMQRYLGGNPPRRHPMLQPPRPQGGKPFWQGNGPRMGPGGGGYGPGGFQFNPDRTRGGKGNGRGNGGVGGGMGPPGPAGNPWDPNVIDQVLNGTGDYAQLMKKLGMPLDPQFLAQQTSLMNNKESALSQLLNQFNVGNAQLDQQNVLGQRSIAGNDAARGLYGSGIMARDNRLLGNDIAQQRLGLQTGFDQGKFGAQQDYRSQMMQALQDLAQRLQGQQNLPLPTWGPWAMGGNR